MLLEYLLRSFGRDLFDLHPAFAGDHQDRLCRGPVDDDPQVQLAGNVAALLDQHLADRLALRSGLDRHQAVA